MSDACVIHRSQPLVFMCQAMPRLRLVSASIVVLMVSGSALRAEPPQPYQLKNGLTVILRPVPTAEDVAVVVLFRLGGDHDPLGKSGRAHLLEHLYCTAAAGDTPARDFAAIQKRYEAGYNQQTGADFTVLAGVVKAKQLTDELTDAAARMNALRITEQDLRREVPRVLQELENMYGGMPAIAGLNHVRMRLHPVPEGGRPGGAAEHVRTITVEELQQLWRQCYQPRNATLVLAGRFDVTTAQKLVEQRFGPIPAGRAPTTAPATLPATLDAKAPARIKVKPLMPGTPGVVAVGYRPPPTTSPDYAPFLVVVSRLWAVEQGGFRPGQLPPVYCPVLDDPRTIVLQVALPSGREAQPLLAQLDQRLQAALTRKITPEDRLRAVNSMAMMLGTVDVPDAAWAANLYGLAFGLGRRHAMGLDGRQLREAINRVTDADLERLARNVFPATQRAEMVVEVDVAK